MATSFLVPGPSYHFYGNGNGFDFLGFAERATRVSFVAMHRELNADYAGEGLPADVAYLGDLAMVSITLSRYNEAVLNRLKGRIKGGVPGGGGLAGNAGLPGVIGSLLVAEGLTFPYIIVSSYGNKPVFTAAGMNSAYYFPQMYAADAIDFELSTGPKLESVLLKSIPVFNSPDGRYLSYQIGLPAGVTLPPVA